MTLGQPLPPRQGKARFSMQCLLRPRTIALLGAETPQGRIIAENLRASGFAGLVVAPRVDIDAVATLPAPPEQAPDFAMLAGPVEAPCGLEPVLAALAARGVPAAVLAGGFAQHGAQHGAQYDTQVPRQDGLRLLGPNSFGVAVPSIGLNATLSHMPIPAGRVALVTQSASLARAVIDWAGPNGIGFSHVVGIGGNADIGFGRVLDWLSRDPGTGLIMMDIRRVRSRSTFISAARAASRLRPVVALRPGGTLIDPSGRAEKIFAAALQRAGVFVVDGLESFLAAAEVLSRAKPLRSEAMAVVTNAVGPGRLAADAALRAGIPLAVLPPHAQAALTGTMPAELTQGLILTGGTAAADIAAMVSAVPGLGGVLVLLSPTGPGDATVVEALIAAAAAAPMPMLCCAMGESTGAAHRQRLAASGVPAFATPEQAVQGFAHLLRDRAARAAARELPPDRVLDVLPDHASVAASLASARAAGRLDLSREEAAAVLAAYGLDPPADGAGQAAIRITAHDDPMFGPAIGLSCGGPSGGGPSAGGPSSGTQAAQFGLPPLNLPLAHRLAAAAGLVADLAEGLADATAQSLVRVSQMLVDEPQIEALLIGGGAAAIRLRPPGERAQLAIAPYPEQLAGIWHGATEIFVVRPIRPEDAAAHAALMRRVPREDLRYRFFSALREVAPEQIGRLTQIDYEREMAFIAVRDSDGSTAGVARLVREYDPACAEFAILVEPAAKGQGLATHLMRRLIDWGAAQGVRRITGQILADNAPMLAFARHLGFQLHAPADDPDIIEAMLDIGGVENEPGKAFFF